jgi:hypothetical protein
VQTCLMRCVGNERRAAAVAAGSCRRTHARAEHNACAAETHTRAQRFTPT